MDLKAGSRWKSTVCQTQVVIVRAPRQAVVLECGGAAMIAHNQDLAQQGSIKADWASGSLLGKRYAHEVSGLEVLCSKPGAGALSADGNALTMKEAKKLPSSD